MIKMDKWDWILLAAAGAWLLGPNVVERIAAKVLVAEVEATMRYWAEEPDEDEEPQ